MFRQLKNKFLILNLIIISVMMIIAFSSIYLITYNNVNRDINEELHRISESNRRPNEGSKEPRPNFDNQTPPPERTVSFTLITDTKGSRMSTLSIFEMEDGFYETAKEEALSKNAAKGSFKLDGTHWTFIKKPYSDGYKIVFLDITSQKGILTNLIYTFLIVASVMFIVIFFISRFFANKSIQPIKEAFDKQKQFIGDASHELKTPLAVINTNVDVLLVFITANGVFNS